MNRKFAIKYFFSLITLFFIIFKVLPTNQQNSGSDSEISEGCSQMKCAPTNHCVTRKFWCKNPPCPQMTYCSKTRKESLKGPSTCNLVQCSKGYICFVKVRQCVWEDNCRQKVARCVTEREYYEGPASCADFQCAEGHKCILRESLCARPPCKILKSCARMSDADKWFKKCKQLNCLSEYECFLRRPTENCDKLPCKHTPDCMLPPEKDLNENCRGWVCPSNEECKAQILEPCNQNICKVSRSCKAPTDSLNNLNILRSKPELKTLIDLEKEFFYREEEKRRLQTILTTNAPIRNKEQNSGYDQTRQLFFKPGENPANIQGYNFELLNNARSVPNLPSLPIYKYPVHIVSTIKPKIFTPEKTTTKTIKSPLWLESVKSKTDMDVINFWAKKAEKNENFMEFHEWLESIRQTLDPEMYRLWLEDVRLTNVNNKNFQDWLPVPVPKNKLNFRHFSDFESKTSDMEDEILSTFPGSNLDDSYDIPEYNKGKNISPSQNFIRSFNNSGNNSKVEKNAVIPAFIIIQTSPQIFDHSIFDPQELVHQILDPRIITALNNYQHFHGPRSLMNNFMTPFPFYHYLPQNNYLNKKSSVPFPHWFNLLNSFPREYPIIPQMNHNFIPSFQWNPPGFGNPNFQPNFNDEKDYTKISESNFNSHKKFNWKDFLSKREKNYFRDEKDEKSKVHRLEYQNPEISEEERQEQELQFVKQILQGILDYDFDGNGEKEKKKETIENDQDILMEALIYLLNEQLDDSQENVSNPKLEMLLDEIEKDEKETKLLEEELYRFHENLNGPLLKRRKGDKIFQSEQNKTLMKQNLNNFIEKYLAVKEKESENSIEKSSKIFNPKDQNSDFNILSQENTKLGNNSPEIILPRAGYFDFVKSSDWIKNQTYKNSTDFKQTGKLAKESKIDDSKESNDDKNR